MTHLTSHESDDLAGTEFEGVEIARITPKLEKFVVGIEHPLEPIETWIRLRITDGR